MNDLLCLTGLFLLLTVVAHGAPENSPPTADPVKPGDMTNVARKIEPNLNGKPERLPQYINFFSRELGNDNRLCAFYVSAEVIDGKRIRLLGHVEFPETKKSLVNILEALGFSVEDQLETLPAESLGNRIFGLVTSPHSYMFDRPSGRRKQENDCLLGEPLLLLREQDGHLLAHSREGYLGYISSSDVLRADAAAYEKYLSGPRVLVTKNQVEKSAVTISAGTRLKWIGIDSGNVTVELPGGRKIALPAAECHVCAVPDETIDTIIQAAQQLLGTQYFWGGRTSEGIDCSGLVQMSYAAAGLHLPRDAYQQFYMGQLTATRWHRAGLRKGDTLYFLAPDGKIRHTGIYLGDGQYLQAVMPKARISSLNPGDPNYDPGHSAGFAFAKRLLD